MLPAADFDALLVRPSRRTDEAALAAFFDVTFFGAFVCDSALAEAVFDFELVLLLCRFFEALLATLELVVFLLAILSLLNSSF